jgi:hypothetical protein
LFCIVNNKILYNIQYFNFILFFNILKYFNLVFYFGFLKNNNLSVKLNFKKSVFNSKNKLFRKNYILNFFNLLFLKKIKKNELLEFNKNYANYKNLINIVYNFNIKKLNYLVFDNNKYLNNLYINMYSFKNLLIYKSYFYINPSYFTHKNFIYFYNQFLVDNNVFLIIIFNLKNVLNFSHVLENLNIILFTFNNKFNFIDSNYNLLTNIDFYKIYLYILLLNQI